ncbi:MAG: flagellar biosynthetic protein FliR [Myxococcota bacterium]
MDDATSSTALLQLALHQAQPWLPLWLLASTRVGIAITALPPPFGEQAPRTVRAALGLVLALALTLPLPGLEHAQATEPLWLLRAAAVEVLVGGVLGLTVRLTLATASIAGSFMGMSSGLAFAQSVDPTLGEQTTPVGRALNSFAAVLFFGLEGHHALFRALGASLRVAPPGGVGDALVEEGIFVVGSSLVASGLRIAAPVMATMFLVQLGLALAARAAPRVQIFQLVFAFAISTSLVTLALAIPSIAATLEDEIARLPLLFAELVGS